MEMMRAAVRAAGFEPAQASNRFTAGPDSPASARPRHADRVDRHRVTGRIRTGDLQGHDLALFPLSYSHSVVGWARTTGLRLIRAALRPAELRRRASGNRDSNPGPRRWRRRALPLSYPRKTKPPRSRTGRGRPIGTRV